MKATHRSDIFSFSIFDESRNLDFHGHAWVRPEGGVLVDPVPMSEHDRAHLEALGGASWIVVTNSDHLRAAVELAAELGASIAAPEAERATFAIEASAWLSAGSAWLEGVEVLALDGSKTPGELALRLSGEGPGGEPGATLITGDLIRAHAGGRLDLLPDAKLSDRAAALRSLRGIVEGPRIEAVLVGDGWPVFRDGHARLEELLLRLS